MFDYLLLLRHNYTYNNGGKYRAKNSKNKKSFQVSTYRIHFISIQQKRPPQPAWLDGLRCVIYPLLAF